MPHTTRHRHNNPQNNNNKRLQVTDDSGWTHVTTTTRARRLPTSTQKGKKTNEKNEKETQLRPAEAPAKLTLDDLRGQFSRHYARWRVSGSWGVVRGVMSGVGRDRDSEKDADADAEIPAQGHEQDIENIICIGLGSPSGFLRGGWVDRRQVSMHQLAALVSIKDLFQSIRVYAQDPVFNTLDTVLLHSLGITVVRHPAAFEQVSARTVLFCPGAERVHLEELLGRMPRVVVGGPLEEMLGYGDGDGNEGESGRDPVRRFLGERRGTKVPVFEADEKAFWGVRVYV